jgi:hypothetical protein
MFLATGEAKAENDVDCDEGEVHSLLILSRQPSGSEADEVLARQGAALAGWRRIRIERSARLAAPPAEPALRAAYEDALELGCSVIADRRVLGAAGAARKRDRRREKGDA